MHATSLAKDDKFVGFGNHSVRDAINQLYSLFDVSKPYRRLPNCKDYSGKNDAKKALGDNFEDYSALPAMCLKCHRMGNKWLQSMLTSLSSSNDASDLNVDDRVTVQEVIGLNTTRTPSQEQQGDVLDDYAFDDELEDAIDEAILEIDETAAEFVQVPTAMRTAPSDNHVGAVVRKKLPKGDKDTKPHFKFLSDTSSGRSETSKGSFNDDVYKCKLTPRGKTISGSGSSLSSGTTVTERKLVPNCSKTVHFEKEVKPAATPGNIWEERSSISKKPNWPPGDILDDEDEDDFFLQSIDLS